MPMNHRPYGSRVRFTNLDAVRHCGANLCLGQHEAPPRMSVAQYKSETRRHNRGRPAEMHARKRQDGAHATMIGASMARPTADHPAGPHGGRQRATRRR